MVGGRGGSKKYQNNPMHSTSIFSPCWRKKRSSPINSVCQRVQSKAAGELVKRDRKASHHSSPSGRRANKSERRWLDMALAQKRFPTHQDRERGDHYGGVAGPS